MKRKFLLFLSVMLVALMPLCASATLIRVVKSSIPSSWNGTVYIHHWKGGDNCAWGSCPKMEEAGDYLQYEIGDHDSFLLKNQPGNATDGHQTDNVTNVTSDATYEFTGDNTIAAVTSVEEGVLTYAVRGDFQENGWSDFKLEGEGDELSVKIKPTLKTSGHFGIRTYKDGIAQTDKWFGGNISISEETPEATLISAENSTWNLTLNREYTFTYNLSTKHLTITWEEETEVLTYAVRGDFQENGWSDFKLTGEGDELSVKITPTLKTSGNFGIRTYKDGEPQPDRWFGGNISISEETPEATLVDGPNSSWNLTLNREYTFTYNLSTKKLKITWEAGEEPEVKDPIYIIGTLEISGNKWASDNGYKLENIPGTNKYYSTEIKVGGDAHIAIVTKLGSWGDINNPEVRFGVSGEITDFSQVYSISGDSNANFKVGVGTFYAIVDMDAKTIEIGEAASHLKSINQPEALYMYGNFFDRHFDFSDPVVAVGEPSTEGDDVTYKFENILIVGATEEGESGYFILGAGEAPANNAALFAATAPERVAPENVDWTGIESTHRYVLGENNVVTPLVANAHPTTAAHCTEIKAGDYVNLNVTLAADGNHTYEISTHDVSTGVEAIEADANAHVEFFNLQGVRVANPENGIFIRRQGNKVTKVAIR